jgi:transposase, IS5 family
MHLRQSAGGKPVIDPRRTQHNFGDKLIADEVKDLQEAWMIHADQVLADEQILELVYEALAKRRHLSRTRGRKATSAEVVLRLLVLKHIRNWSYVVLEREVRANLLYRNFTRVGFAKMPDAKTMGRWGVALGPEIIKQIHGRIVHIAQEKGIAQGRRMRVDTTVVETNIHYPTDSSLLGDGVRVLTRVMKKITGIVGEVGAQLRDRSRSVKYRVMEIARAARAKAVQSKAKLEKAYGNLLSSTSRVVGQAKRFAMEIADGTKRARGIVRQAKLQLLRHELEIMLPRVRQVMKQARARIFRGETRTQGKILSLFEPTTEIIRKGKAGKPNEFGKMVKLQETENQIVTDYEVYDQRPNDANLLIPAIETHAAMLGRMPRLVAADAGFYSAKNEAAAMARGVKRVCIPNRSTKNTTRKREQKKRWFRNGQKWRTGCEGRISVVKRRHGLTRCRYKGDSGMKRWVGLGVIADNLINIGNAMARQAEP